MRKALCGWLAIVAVVAVFDLAAVRRGEHTLSSAFRYASRHKTGRFFVSSVWVLLTTHLFVGRP